jgi:hypothetical protein
MVTDIRRYVLSTETLARISVEVLVEQQQIFPVRI